MIKCDPEASQSLLSNPILAPKTTLIGLDLTHQVLATISVQERVLKASISEASTASDLRRMLFDLLVFFGSTYDTQFGMADPPLHDPLAVAVILSNLNPEYAQAHPDSVLRFDDKNGERFAVKVVTDGQHGSTTDVTGQLGRTIAKATEGAGVSIPRGVDTEVFWGLVLSCLERAEQCSPMRK
jgi:uridine nucleosidase